MTKEIKTIADFLESDLYKKASDIYKESDNQKPFEQCIKEVFAYTHTVTIPHNVDYHAINYQNYKQDKSNNQQTVYSLEGNFISTTGYKDEFSSIIYRANDHIGGLIQKQNSKDKTIPKIQEETKSSFDKVYTKIASCISELEKCQENGLMKISMEGKEVKFGLSDELKKAVQKEIRDLKLRENTTPTPTTQKKEKIMTQDTNDDKTNNKNATDFMNTNVYIKMILESNYEGRNLSKEQYSLDETMKWLISGHPKDLNRSEARLEFKYGKFVPIDGQADGNDRIYAEELNEYIDNGTLEITNGEDGIEIKVKGDNNKLETLDKVFTGKEHKKISQGVKEVESFDSETTEEPNLETEPRQEEQEPTKSRALENLKKAGAVVADGFRLVRSVTGYNEPITSIQRQVDENKEKLRKEDGASKKVSGRYGEGNPAQKLFGEANEGSKDFKLPTKDQAGQGVGFDIETQRFRAFGEANLTPKMMQFNELMDSGMFKPLTQKKIDNLKLETTTGREVKSDTTNLTGTRREGLDYTVKKAPEAYKGIEGYLNGSQKPDGMQFYVSKDATTSGPSKKAIQKDKENIYYQKDGKTKVRKTFVLKMVAYSALIVAGAGLSATGAGALVGAPMMALGVGGIVKSTAGSRIASRFNKYLEKRDSNKKLKQFGMGKDALQRPREMEPVRDLLKGIEKGQLTLQMIEDKDPKVFENLKSQNMIVQDSKGNWKVTDDLKGGLTTPVTSYLKRSFRGEIGGEWGNIKDEFGFNANTGKIIGFTIANALTAGLFGALIYGPYKAKERMDRREAFDSNSLFRGGRDRLSENQSASNSLADQYNKAHGLTQEQQQQKRNSEIQNGNRSPSGTIFRAMPANPIENQFPAKARSASMPPSLDSTAQLKDQTIATQRPKSAPPVPGPSPKSRLSSINGAPSVVQTDSNTTISTTLGKGTPPPAPITPKPPVPTSLKPQDNKVHDGPPKPNYANNIEEQKKTASLQNQVFGDAMKKSSAKDNVTQVTTAPQNPNKITAIGITTTSSAVSTESKSNTVQNLLTNTTDLANKVQDQELQARRQELEAKKLALEDRKNRLEDMKRKEKEKEEEKELTKSESTNQELKSILKTQLEEALEKRKEKKLAGGITEGGPSSTPDVSKNKTPGINK